MMEKITKGNQVALLPDRNYPDINCRDKVVMTDSWIKPGDEGKKLLNSETGIEHTILKVEEEEFFELISKSSHPFGNRWGYVKKSVLTLDTKEGIKVGSILSIIDQRR